MFLLQHNHARCWHACRIDHSHTKEPALWHPPGLQTPAHPPLTVNGITHKQPTPHTVRSRVLPRQCCRMGRDSSAPLLHHNTTEQYSVCMYCLQYNLCCSTNPACSACCAPPAATCVMPCGRTQHAASHVNQGVDDTGLQPLHSTCAQRQPQQHSKLHTHAHRHHQQQQLRAQPSGAPCAGLLPNRYVAPTRATSPTDSR